MQKREGGDFRENDELFVFLKKKEYKNDNNFVIQDDISITVGSTGTW